MVKTSKKGPKKAFFGRFLTIHHARS